MKKVLLTMLFAGLIILPVQATYYGTYGTGAGSDGNENTSVGYYAGHECSWYHRVT